MTKIYSMVWKSRITGRFTGEVYQEGDEDLMKTLAEEYKKLAEDGRVLIFSGKVGE